MKYLIIFILLTFTYAYSEAQSLRYDTCNALHQFEGEWININGQDTIRIYLKKLRTNNQMNNHTTINDGLWGWIEYKQGNTAIMSDYANRNNPSSTNFDEMVDLSSILVWNRNCNETEITGILSDINRNYALVKWDATTTFTSSGAAMNVHVYPTASFWFGSGGQTTITLPNWFILVKQ